MNCDKTKDIQVKGTTTRYDQPKKKVKFFCRARYMTFAGDEDDWAFTDITLPAQDTYVEVLCSQRPSLEAIIDIIREVRSNDDFQDIGLFLIYYEHGVGQVSTVQFLFLLDVNDTLDDAIYDAFYLYQKESTAPKMYYSEAPKGVAISTLAVPH
eukprot:scpid91337/ scgid10356/ 